MNRNRVDAVDRALLILETLGGERQRLTLHEVAERTGLYKSTILRLAGSLEHFGYLTRDEDGTFRLGPTLWRLGSMYRRSFNLGDSIRPVLRQIVEATRETASYYVQDGDSRVCLFRHNSPRELRHHLEEGARLPLDRGAAGQVLCAFGGLGGTLFERIRAQGYYVSLGERVPEIAAIAVPVITPDGVLKGALAVSGFRSRFTQEFQRQAIACLREEAVRLGQVLGGDLGGD